MKSILPLNAVSYLQRLANANPRMVSEASTYFYSLRDKFDKKELSNEKYLNLIEAHIEKEKTQP
ncbi:MAG: hypothetical protein LBL60_02075 [Mycoplasmataceae bacterium]|jgi:hypothetical protein|nr:hypothetical protein [Mycoplasmataceae bacterium]